MYILSLIPLLPYIFAAPTTLPDSSLDNRSLTARFGPLKHHSKVRDNHDKHWQTTTRDIHTGNFEMIWYLHAQDQVAVDTAIYDISNPESPRYHQWLSKEEAEELTKADPQGVATILEYLSAHGIDLESTKLAPHNRTISFKVKTDAANQMLDADYKYHTTTSHPDTGRHTRQLGSRTISLPETIHHLVAFVFPGPEFGQLVRHGIKRKDFVPISEEQIKRTKENDEILERWMKERDEFDKQEMKRAVIPNTGNGTGSGSGIGIGKNVTGIQKVGDIKVHPIVEVVVGPNTPPPTSALNNCWQVTTPTCLRAMYHMPVNYATAGTSVATMNFRPQNYSASYFTQGMTYLNPNIPASYQPDYVEIAVSGQDTVAITEEGEADLDTQTVAPLVYPMKFYNMLGPNLSLNSLYGAVAQLGTNNLPRPDVLSISYGAPELDPSSQASFCNMADNIILQETTCLASTGDTGDQDIEAPALCPHWIGVGATDLSRGSTYTANSVSEEAADGWTYKGSGGFSQQGATAPSYQTAAIAAYKAKYTDPTYSQYQSNAATPDVGAQGRNYPVYTVGGSGEGFYLSGGTSLSAPIFASLIALINGQRIAAGKSTVGNPLTTLYQTPTLFRDTTGGNNCHENLAGGNKPWPATAGWDPSTGMGTPLYDRFSKYYANAS